MSSQNTKGNQSLNHPNRHPTYPSNKEPFSQNTTSAPSGSTTKKHASIRVTRMKRFNTTMRFSLDYDSLTASRDMHVWTWES